MTDHITLAAARPDGPPQELINRLNETAAFHRPERLDADDAPEYTWREIREITDLLSEAAAALSASRTAQAPQQDATGKRIEQHLSAVEDSPDWADLAEILDWYKRDVGVLLAERRGLQDRIKFTADYETLKFGQEASRTAQAPKQELTATQAERVWVVRTMAEMQRAIGYSYRDTAPDTAKEWEYRAEALFAAADALEVSRTDPAVPPQEKWALMLPDGVSALEAKSLMTGRLLSDADSFQWVKAVDVAASPPAASRTAQAPQDDDPIATQINALIKLYGSGEAVIRAMLSASRTDPAVPPQESQEDAK